MKRLVRGLACLWTATALWTGATTLRAQQPPPGLPAGVQDVVKLTKAGMTEEVILAQIKNSGMSYNLTADQVIYLNDQGVSQNVIKALLATTPATPSTSPQVSPGLAPNTQPGSVPPPVPNIYAPAPYPSAPNMPSPTSPAPAPVSFDYFQPQLAPYGTWVNEPGYGLCWRPTVAVSNPYWRPYVDQGNWVYTDNGWFWQSGYPWGEIVFHYGRWHRDAIGWLWVPGYDWAPAWVCWRHADGYCGWAPLPPGAVFRSGVGLVFNGRVGVDVDFGLGFGAFTFVAYDHFWDHNLHAYILPRDRAQAVFRRSVVMNGYRFDHGRFVMDGLGRDRIAGWTHREVRAEAPRFRDEHIQRHFEMLGRGSFRDTPGREERRDWR